VSQVSIYPGRLIICPGVKKVFFSEEMNTGGGPTPACQPPVFFENIEWAMISGAFTLRICTTY